MKVEKDCVIFTEYELTKEGKYYIHKINCCNYNTKYKIKVGYIEDIDEKFRYGYVKILNKFDMDDSGNEVILIPSIEGEYIIEYREDIRPILPRNRQKYKRVFQYIIYDSMGWRSFAIFLEIPPLKYDI